MQDLQTFLDLLTKGRRLHISILDLSGILHTPMTRISFGNVIHSKHFCDMAKSTDKGYRLCLHCKALANARGTTGKMPFAGHCPWGLYEAARPVLIGDTVAAIVYVGNSVIDRAYTLSRIKKSCRHTGVDADALCREIEECEYLDDPQEVERLAEIVCDYLKMICEKTPRTADTHWLVSLLKRHAEDAYCTELSLRQLARIYHKNEKYMGRLFKKETGVGFREYCNRLRLEKAAGMLKSTADKVLDIAMECGFDNVSYFNRIFQKQYGMSPTAYRLHNEKNGG
ncbi:MAG: helix-turn-helix domain-containing protein [Clostridia bacterium]|nr:helix-turn-helix domain-containing protein [Clostridia bacterium]